MAKTKQANSLQWGGPKIAMKRFLWVKGNFIGGSIPAKKCQKNVEKNQFSPGGINDFKLNFLNG